MEIPFQKRHPLERVSRLHIALNSFSCFHAGENRVPNIPGDIYQLSDAFLGNGRAPDGCERLVTDMMAFVTSKIYLLLSFGKE